jgi:hypothetical protein
MRSFPTSRTDNAPHLRGKHELRGFGAAVSPRKSDKIPIHGELIRYDRGTFAMAPAGK